MQQHEFGGEWTTEKLERVGKYLAAYTKLFEGNEAARYFNTTYVDAFAGTGYHSVSHHEAPPGIPLPELIEEDVAFLKGSSRIALEVQPSFKRYIFVERSAERCQELEKLKDDFPQHAPKIKVVTADANSFLLRWCNRTDWKKNRAVVFLDPYGMQVEWSAIEAIAQTQAIDLWILFPLGVGVNRLLKRSGPPPEKWAQALTRIFGTEEWRNAFYSKEHVLTLFGEEEQEVKQADFDSIGKYFVQRLESVFAAVADNPLPLMNSRNNPLYLLCFAAGNPKGAPIAVRIAKNILRR